MQNAQISGNFNSIKPNIAIKCQGKATGNNDEIAIKKGRRVFPVLLVRRKIPD
jgi:hypothetical protein